VISVGSPGSAGNVITDGSGGSENAPGDGLVLIVGVSGFALDEVGISVVIVGADSRYVCCGVGGTTGATLDGGDSVDVGGVVIKMGAGSCGGAPRASWIMPQTINAIRTAIRVAQPANAIGLRQPGIGSSSSGS
jgi:hypothetical protein